jgi:mRNA interferase MazF
LRYGTFRKNIPSQYETTTALEEPTAPHIADGPYAQCTVRSSLDCDGIVDVRPGIAASIFECTQRVGMGRINAYHYYWVDLGPVYGSRMAKTRPALVISPNVLNRMLSTVVVVPLTTKHRTYPGRIRTVLSGIAADACFDQIQTLPNTALQPRAIRRATDRERRQFNAALTELYLTSSS